jgi:hypothetical protein
LGRERHQVGRGGARNRLFPSFVFFFELNFWDLSGDFFGGIWDL